jgi:L-ascorbate metabolism protein UlaG (beta-lactamase superfamily)
MLTITYASHSTFLFSDGEHSVVVDPYFTGNPTNPIRMEDVDAKFIVLTHAHNDHLGDTLRLAERNDALVIAVNELARYVALQGAKAHNMHIGGACAFPFGRVKFTIAHHGSSGPDGRYMGEPAGVVLTLGGKKVYHCGDTGLFLDMQLIGQRDAIDVMCVPIGGNFTMDAADGVEAVKFVKPGLAIPMHFNTWPIIETDPEAFRTGVADAGLACRVMGYGETLTL